MSWIVCAEVTLAAHRVIEKNGGSVEVLRGSEPHLELITLPTEDVRYHGPSARDSLRAFELVSADRVGVCWWNSDPISCVVYRWNGEEIDDPVWPVFGQE